MAKLHVLDIIALGIFATIASLYLLAITHRFFNRSRDNIDQMILGDASLLGREDLRERKKPPRPEAEPRGA